MKALQAIEGNVNHNNAMLKHNHMSGLGGTPWNNKHKINKLILGEP